MTGPPSPGAPRSPTAGARARRPATTGAWVRTGVDAAFLLVLSGLGLYSFRALYGGWQYLLVGLIGTACGLVVAEASLRWWKPVLGAAVVTVVVFVVVGGVLAGGDRLGASVPTPGAVSAVLKAATYGWKQLLTTAPPVGNSAHLLAIPYLVGLVAGVSGQSLALRTRAAALPLVAPGGVLVLGILFGSRVPASLLLQGTVFGGVCLAWAGVRHHRFRPVSGSSGFSRTRAALAAGTLVVTALAAGVVGPDLPGAGSHTRVVLSRYVVPPLNVSRQPSPLAGFRQYAEGGTHHRTVLFTVHGVRPGGYMRIAVMDEYNGIVWGFGAARAGGAVVTGDAFENYGSTIPAGQSGKSGTVSVTIGGLGGIWMPTIGETTGVAFTAGAGPAAQGNFRYDPATEAAAQPAGLHHGEHYRLEVVVPPYPSRNALKTAAAGGASLALSDVPPVLRTDAIHWAGNAVGPWAKVSAIATHFKRVGKYSNGNESPTLSLPGEDAGRLTTFLQGGGLVGTQIVGDDEQYAATLALMANAVGVPGRVVLGAKVGAGGVVRGSDVHAWVEVLLEGLGWVPVYPNAFLPSQPPVKNPPTQTPQQSSAATVQPPISSAQRSPLALGFVTAKGSSSAQAVHGGSPSSFPAWVRSLLTWAGPPLAAVVLAVGVIAALKSRRRRRRRRSARTSARVAGAWAELIDLQRDLGRTVPLRATRREQAAHLALTTAARLAHDADAAIFGPTEPTVEEVDAYWRSINEAIAAIRAGVSWLQRWKASLSLRSLGSTSANGGV